MVKKTTKETPLTISLNAARLEDDLEILINAAFPVEKRAFVNNLFMPQHILKERLEQYAKNNKIFEFTYAHDYESLLSDLLNLEQEFLETMGDWGSVEDILKSPGRGSVHLIIEKYPDLEISKIMTQMKEKLDDETYLEVLKYIDKVTRWSKDLEYGTKVAETVSKYNPRLATNLAFELANAWGHEVVGPDKSRSMTACFADEEIADIVNNYPKKIKKYKLGGVGFKEEVAMLIWLLPMARKDFNFTKKAAKLLDKFPHEVSHALFKYILRSGCEGSLETARRSGETASKYKRGRDYIAVIMNSIKDAEVFDKDFVRETIEKLDKTDTHIARMLARTIANGVYEFFGKYFESLMNYFKRRKSLFEIESLCKNEDKFTDYKKGHIVAKKLKNFIENSDFGERLGNKKIKPLLDIWEYCPLFLSMDIDADFSNIDNKHPRKAAKQLALQLKDKIKEKYDVDIKDTRILRTFAPYIPYLKNDDNFSDLVKKVLDTSLLTPKSFAVKVNPGGGVDLNKFYDDLQELIPLYNNLTGKNISVQENKSLDDYVSLATELYEGVREWKRENANKFEQKTEWKELEPNLERLANTKDRSGKSYKIVFNPNDYKTQLIALSKIRSCISPDAFNFKYSQRYLTETDNHVFFATIHDLENRVVGRATVAIGYDTEDQNKKYIQRISNIYNLSAGITGKIFDSVLKRYAREIGAEILPKDKAMTVPGIGSDAYDDLVKCTGEKNIIKVHSTGRAYS